MKRLSIIFILSMLTLAFTCDKPTPLCDQDAPFCSIVDSGNYDDLRPLIDDFLANQIGNAEEQLDALEQWLECKSCVSRVKILCNSCIETMPPKSELEVVFISNGNKEKKVMDITMGEPATFSGFH